MWVYEKKLQYPVKIAQPNAKLAKVIITQLGGPVFMFSQSISSGSGLSHAAPKINYYLQRYIQKI